MASPVAAAEDAAFLDVAGIMDAGVNAALGNLGGAVEEGLLFVGEDGAEDSSEGERAHGMSAGIAEAGNGEQGFDDAGMAW